MHNPVKSGSFRKNQFGKNYHEKNMPGRAKLVLYIDLQQVYLLQSEAQKDKIVTFICEYFRHHGRIKH